MCMNENIKIAMETEDPLLLSRLTVDKDWVVRQQVACNEYTKEEDLVILSKDKNILVKAAVALNNKCPDYILFAFFTDWNITVRTNAYYNKNADIVLREAVVYFGGVKRNEEKESFYQFLNRSKTK